MSNLDLWNKLKHVPENRLKTIQAGRLRGKSDINPQWRYEVLTEHFGLCGVGWKYTIDKMWTQDHQNGEIACFVNISLFLKVEGEWSDAIMANGGSMFVANEKNGPFVSDECYKMAITDAIGTAAKMIGVAAEIYLGDKDKNIAPQTKYEQKPQQTPPTKPTDNRPWLNKGTEQWKNCVVALRGSFTISDIEKKYRLSKENKESLMEEAAQ